MRAGAGKSKGASFEREVCRRLSLYLSGGRRDDLLWRSAMSGGRATIQFDAGRVNLTQSGDVTAVGMEAYDFVERTFVEVKHYRDLRIARSIVCGTGDLVAFWKKTVEESSKYGKRPMLVARQNLYPTLVVTKSSDDVFGDPVMIVLNHWQAHVRLFDEVTKVRIPLQRGAN